MRNLVLFLCYLSISPNLHAESSATLRYKLDKLERERAQGITTNHVAMSWSRCILKEMPGVQNQATAHAVNNHCKQFPKFSGKKTPEFLFGPKTSYDCVLSKGKKTSDRVAGIFIKNACESLYPDS